MVVFLKDVFIIFYGFYIVFFIVVIFRIKIFLDF